MTHAHPSLPNSMHEYISKWHMKNSPRLPRTALFQPPTKVQSVSPALLRFALDVSQCDSHIAPDRITSGQQPGHPRLGPAFAGITQCTQTPKALEEFKGENDCNEWQLEKDCGEVRRMKARSMAAPPSRRPSCSCSGRTPSSPGHAVRRGPKESDGLALLGPNC